MKTRVLTSDGLVHIASPGPEGPTTACGRTDRAIAVASNLPTADCCLARMTAADPRTPTPDGHATCPRCEQKARTA